MIPMIPFASVSSLFFACTRNSLYVFHTGWRKVEVQGRLRMRLAGVPFFEVAGPTPFWERISRGLFESLDATGCWCSAPSRRHTKGCALRAASDLDVHPGQLPDEAGHHIFRHPGTPGRGERGTLVAPSRGLPGVATGQIPKLFYPITH